METMQLDVTTKDGATILRIGENITFSNTKDFKTTLDETVANTSGGLILDMELVSFINSTGIGIIASAFNALKARSASLILFKPRPEVLRVLKIIGFDTMMPVTNDEKQAIDLCIS